VVEFFVEADESFGLLKQLAEDPDLASGSEKANGDLRTLGHRLTTIWTQYQEQPGLLDPHLEKMVSTLVGLLAQRVHAENCVKQSDAREHLACSLLYTLCTVRGYKQG
tara:strand:- start:1932 stop:2255 length:324 start_codon:yes stop_codon:yes gene_type:complete